MQVNRSSSSLSSARSRGRPQRGAVPLLYFSPAAGLVNNFSRRSGGTGTARGGPSEGLRAVWRLVMTRWTATPSGTPAASEARPRRHRRPSPPTRPAPSSPHSTPTRRPGRPTCPTFVRFMLATGCRVGVGTASTFDRVSQTCLDVAAERGRAIVRRSAGTPQCNRTQRADCRSTPRPQSVRSPGRPPRSPDHSWIPPPPRPTVAGPEEGPAHCSSRGPGQPGYPRAGEPGLPPPGAHEHLHNTCSTTAADCRE